jgi:hypothetical protein
MSGKLSVREETDLYLQELLVAQFEVSQRIEHRLSKGELREEFIIERIHNEFPDIKLCRGILCDGSWQSKQLDFIWLTDKARLGSRYIYDLCDCKLMMEIKSDAKRSEIRDCNQVSGLIKGKCKTGQNILSGMFCYTTSSSKRSIIQSFGFKYEKDIDSYSKYNPKEDLYPSVDFFFCLDCIHEDNPYFIVRDCFGCNTLILQNPVIGYLINMFR